MTAAYRMLQRFPQRQLTLFEQSPTTGGVIGTFRENGRLVELGPNGFLDSKIDVVDLCNELGLKLERAKAESAERFILVGDRLRRVPKTPGEFLKSDVLSVRGKLRFLWERFSGSASNADDESIADFGRRHFGSEATETLLDAVATGIYAGDIEKLSIRSCFPRIVELESRFGSLLRAQGVLAKEKKKTGAPVGIGTLASPVGGMGRLIERLRQSIGNNIKFGKPVERVERNGNGWRLSVASEILDYDAVVLAVPSHIARLILKTHDGLLKELTQIESAPAVVVALAYKRSELKSPPIGFGYLAPERLGRPVLGVIYSSNVFENQAPSEEFMFRAILGGDRRRDVFDWNDAQLIDAVRKDLKELLHIDATPTFQLVQRWKHAIPQYHVGHGARLRRIEAELDKLPGLFQTGASYRGVSVADCVKDGNSVADRVAHYLEDASSRGHQR